MKSSASFVRLLATGFLAALPIFAAEKAAPLSALGRMPVKEITAFKDGHCFVVQQGPLPTDADGDVLMDQLPSPVIGTFWPYSTEPGARLTGVVAGERRVTVPRTALALRELLEANVGAEVIITEASRYHATIVGFPSRSGEELARTSATNSGERLPEKGELVLLRTDEGTKAVNVRSITDVIFKNPPNTRSETEEFRNLLTLKLDWNGRQPNANANVGLFYLQKGVRWIPSYKVELDGKGQAVVKLQATILNELTDLVDADVNLVIGVPSFAFKETLDPMALQQTAAQLSQFFGGNQNNAGRNSLIAANFSNAIMTQQARMGEYRGQGEGQDAAPDAPEGTKNEDLFVFSLKRITLKKGERMVVPVAEYTLPYRDVFTLDLPFAPPPEVRGNINSSQQQELARLFNAPKVMHKVRLTNKSAQPLTTAPALILRDGRVLSQGMMTYTAAGAETDLAVTTAVDISVKKSDVETERVPNAVKHDGSSFARINLTGTIKLTSHRGQPAVMEVNRHVLGTATEAGKQGVIDKVNVFENGDSIGAGDYPSWWPLYGWPNWWHHINGISRITWKTTLEANQTVELDYRWHYFWR